MSDGHFCFVRDLGLVKGGKGMKHHEVVIDFSRRGMATFIKRALSRSPQPEAQDLIPYHLSARKAQR